MDEQIVYDDFTSDIRNKYIKILKKIYGNHIRRIILFDSYARGDFKFDSDVDIMILLDISDIESKKYFYDLSYQTYDFNLDNNIDINPIVKSEQFYNKWKDVYPFYANKSASDYDDFYVASVSETKELIETAYKFLNEVEAYCDRRLSDENK